MPWFATDQLVTIVASSKEEAQKVAGRWGYGRVTTELKPGQFAFEQATAKKEAPNV